MISPHLKDSRLKACTRIAWVLRDMYLEYGHSSSELFRAPLMPDHLAELGPSKSRGSQREHIVPCKVICDECHNLVEQGASVEEIADFINQVLFIVWLSREERALLDRKDRANLKSKMPDGWDFKSGDVFARLHAAGIAFEASA